MSDTSEIEKLILQAARLNWLKVARVITDIAKKLGIDFRND